MKKRFDKNVSNFAQVVKLPNNEAKLQEARDELKILEEMLLEGDFDEDVIAVFRGMKLDLKRNTTSSNWKLPDSCYRFLAQNIGLDPKEDVLVKELYSMIMFNKRGIRDRIFEKCADNGDTDQQLSKVIRVEIPPYSPDYGVPPKLSDRDPSELLTSTGESASHSPPAQLRPSVYAHLSNLSINKEKPRERPKNIEKNQQPMSEVKDVNWGHESVNKFCPRCQNVGHTKIQYRIGPCTLAWVIALFLSGICLPCFWFPLALPCTKDSLHICRSCNFILGKVHRHPCTKSDDWDWNKNEVNTPKKFDEAVFKDKLTAHKK